MPGGFENMFPLPGPFDRGAVQPGAAGAAAGGVGAQAYTQGADIQFGGGLHGGWAGPNSQVGAGVGGGAGGNSQLLGHELTHVIQQRAGMADINAAVGHYGQ